MILLKKIWRPLLALLLIIILIKKGPFQPEQLKQTFSQPRILFLGFFLLFLQLIITSFRWRLFINLIVKVPFVKIVKLNLIGYFFNYFIPGGVGGDIVKAIELSNHNHGSKSKALSTVMSDRIFGLFAMVSFTFIFLLIEYFINTAPYLVKFLLLSGLLLVGILVSLLFLPIIFKMISSHLSKKKSNLILKIEKLISSLHFTFVTFRNFKIQIKSFFMSFVAQVIAIYFMFEVVKNLGVTEPSFFVFFSLCCFVFVASAIPIFPAGIGVGQAAIFVIFSNISAELAQASVTAITAMQVFNFFYALIGGAIFSFLPKKSKEVVAI